ncbi:hypothetical protein JNUCC64_05645 [Streptomyces sp. JNUCC 64]
MAESVPVRCPVCRRDHQFVPTAYPCPCGEPVAPRVAPGREPENVTDRAWSADWVRVPCPSCGREDPWPRPELGCGCGAVLRVPLAAPADAPPDGPPSSTGASPSAPPPVAPPAAASTGAAPPPSDAPDPAPDPAPAPDPVARPTERDGPDREHGRDGGGRFPAHIPLPATASTPRPAFRPTVIRTARDAVTVIALYLRWLGYREIRRAAEPAPSGVPLTSDGLVAVVEPTVRRASARDVECLWLVSLAEAVGCAYFTLAGYEEGVRERADALGVPLFVVDLAGVPRPVNTVAEELVSTGA